MLPSRESASLVPRVSGSANMTEAVLWEGEGGHVGSDPFAESAVCFEASPLRNGLRVFRLMVGRLGIHRAKPVAAGCCGASGGAVAIVVTACGMQ